MSNVTDYVSGQTDLCMQSTVLTDIEKQFYYIFLKSDVLMYYIEMLVGQWILQEH